ncbi:uncharacterized protein [Lolium perenne]|uniref:uncharacterized protein isoform X5 n=1 Tax=Lolium perenne TaxID=4522 RepID=UPI0021F636FF|nr:uncharacterized protein LOC127314861 isoform X8 [Lolium perenne]
MGCRMADGAESMADIPLKMDDLLNKAMDGPSSVQEAGLPFIPAEYKITSGMEGQEQQRQKLDHMPAGSKDRGSVSKEQS